MPFEIFPFTIWSVHAGGLRLGSSEAVLSFSTLFSLSLPLTVKGVCDLSEEGHRLMALRKAEPSSADFWKVFVFAGEICMKGGADWDCIWDVIWWEKRFLFVGSVPTATPWSRSKTSRSCGELSSPNGEDRKCQKVQKKWSRCSSGPCI